jgi:hypothetical protein
MKILLTNRALFNVGGSELVTVELAEEYTRQGHDVTVYTHMVGGPLDVSHLNVVTQCPATDDFDLLWIHHNMLIHGLGFRKRPGQRIVFNHMSSYIADEWPRLASYEMALADRILANSEETRRVLLDKGLRGVELFQNPAPLCWGQSCVMPHLGGLSVSNHPPEEIKALGLASIGGPNGGTGQRRLTPTDLRSHHFVVCNGKTVVYALRAGVPVYLYDMFGGPGWLTEENFARAEEFNFSGRGFSRKTTEQIRAELAVIPAPLPCPDRFKLECVL